MGATLNQAPPRRANDRGHGHKEDPLVSRQSPSRRSYGTGQLYVKSGAWYGRWWIDGQRVNRKLGAVREPGTREGLTKREAEAAMRRQIQLVTAAPSHEKLSVTQV